MVKPRCIHDKPNGGCDIYMWCSYGIGFQTPAPNRIDKRNCDKYNREYDVWKKRIVHLWNPEQ